MIYNTFLHGFCQVAKFEEVLCEMNTYGIPPNIITLNILMDYQYKNGHLAETQAMLKGFEVANLGLKEKVLHNCVPLNTTSLTTTKKWS